MQSANGGGGGGGGEMNQQQQQHQHQQQQQQWMQQYQQQQWMMMYPAAAMAMQQQQHQQQQQMLMYPQHYMPYAHLHQQQQQQQQQQLQQQQLPQEQQQQQQQSQSQLGSTEDAKTVWIGDLHHWMDESYLHNCFSQTGEVSSLKVIRNKHTGQSEGYGFIEFFSHSAAEKVLQSYNGTIMPNAEQPFRLNWATVSSGDRRSDGGSDLSIFVGDLAPDVTDRLLQETFASRYPSVKGAKVVSDANTGRSKGYGFVRFGDESEKSRAITEMNGVLCSSRPMRLGVATPKKATGSGYQQYSSQALVLAGGNASNGTMPLGSQTQTDSNSSNTTIFVGGIDSDVTDEDLRLPFSQYGEVISIKIPIGKGCGFVQFANRNNAEDAMQGLNGTIIGNQTVRLSWGRNQGNKQWRTDPSKQWNGATYGGQQAYSGYGYAMPQSQDYTASAAYGAS